MGTLLETAETIEALPDAAFATDSTTVRSTLLHAGEFIMERWLQAQGMQPTDELHEGFRLLALQRQAACADATFNACRESCRELVYQCNVAEAANDTHERAQHLRLAASVTKHLALFIDGKLENRALGEFCCSSRPLRAQDAEAARRIAPDRGTHG
ncbi:MAG: hypothetical protein ACYC97_05750 [Metallibacterium sp.]